VEGDNSYAKMPVPLGGYPFNPEHARQNAEALRAAFGKWPGDETDEEVEAALKEIR
jgi:hypothetical protein